MVFGKKKNVAILYCEDDTNFLEAISETLEESYPSQFITATSGKDAITLIRSFEFQLVISGYTGTGWPFPALILQSPDHEADYGCRRSPVD